MRALLTALAALAVAAPATAAPPRTLPDLVDRYVPALEQAAAAARSQGPEAIQARYDAARELQVALGARKAPGCPELHRHLVRYAAANIRAAEAFDRLRPAAIPRHDTIARAALEGVRRTERSCRDGALAAAEEGVPLRAAELRASRVLVAASSPRAARPDAMLERRLMAALKGFDGESAAWVYDLSRGRAAGVRGDDRYPAASTVKLGLLVAALARFGAGRAVAHDLETMSSWSSNLAANRLWRLVGGDAAVEATLHRLGATASTFPGPYRAGTSRAAPPLVSQRLTTARDLGSVLVRLHGAAIGRPSALRATRLTRREARVALGLLMTAEDTEGALAPPDPAARKHGWLQSARHTAAIVYSARGPVVVVLLTYRDGLETREAQRVGARVLAAALARA